MDSKLTFDVAQIGAGAELAWALFVEQLYARNLFFLENTAWDTSLDSEEFPKTLASIHWRSVFFSAHSNEAYGVFDAGDGLLVEIWTRGNSIGVNTAQSARDTERHAACIGNLRRLFPLVEPFEDEKKARVKFWMEAQGQPSSVTRVIDVPDWPDVEDNYPAAVRPQLDDLINDFHPDSGGKLILWHGPPGTGKTFALRSLSYAWRHWCDIEYVVDPEAFFGIASYMMRVVVSRDGGGHDSPFELLAKHKEVHPLAKDGRWRLLVLEDAGEMRREDAKLREGQSLSRFLNVADGLIGQGMKIIALVTTNEKLGKLHPAVARAGRCAAEIEFTPFTRDEAAAWLRGRHVGGEHEPEAVLPPGEKIMLADLYGALEGFHGAKGPTKEPMGLAR